MVRHVLPCFAAAALICTFSTPAGAQDVPEAPPPAHVSYVDGSAVLERDGRPESSPLNMPLLTGDRLHTDSGRLEVLFGDGTALQMDRDTTIDVQSAVLLRLMDGRVRLSVTSITPDSPYRIDSPAGSVRVDAPGEYRIAMLHGQADPADPASGETQIELAVVRGDASIFTDQGETDVQAGQRAYASAGLLPSYALAFNSAPSDDFDQWVEARRDERLGTSTSAQYLPEDVQSYAPVFDEYGSWQYQPSYGYVWYPQVASTWRPYYNGRWMSYPRYGWTWIGADRFSWPTHHYGRWGFSAGAWFWIPGHQWAPAYVAWAYAPGYVSWCPLGFNNHAVLNIGFSVGPGYYSAFNAWTVVRAPYFGHGYVHHGAVSVATLRAGHGPAFSVGSTAPHVRDRGWSGQRLDAATPRSVNRGTAMLRSSGARSMPPRDPIASTAPLNVGRTSVDRGTVVPRYINRGDRIVRSQTERPTPPRTDSAPAERVEGGSVERGRMPSQGERLSYGSGMTRSGITRSAPGAGLAMPRMRTDQPTPSRSNALPYYTRQAVPRGDSPAYAPNYAPRYSSPSPGRTAPSMRDRSDYAPGTRAMPEGPRYAVPRGRSAPMPAPRYETPRYQLPRYSVPGSSAPGYAVPRAMPSMPSRIDAPRAAPRQPATSAPRGGGGGGGGAARRGGGGRG